MTLSALDFMDLEWIRCRIIALENFVRGVGNLGMRGALSSHAAHPSWSFRHACPELQGGPPPVVTINYIPAKSEGLAYSAYDATCGGFPAAWCPQASARIIVA
jgi:hypothetical protein